MDSTHLKSNAVAVQDKTEVGSVANGSAGSWDVGLDESLDGPQRWFLQLEGPSIYLYFEIENPQVVDAVLCFLEQFVESAKLANSSLAQNGELQISSIDRTRISLIGDDEGDQRIFILIENAADCVSRFTLASDDLRHLKDALRQVRDELCHEGLLTIAS